MRKFVFYSDQAGKNNEKIDAKLLSLIHKANARVGYIPSGGDKERKYYREICAYYKKLGIEDCFFFDIDEEYDALSLGELISCDVIHLSAGDPIYFVQNLKKRNLFQVLRHFADRGGILVGVSGGSLQLTKTVAVYKSFIGNLDAVTEKDYVELSALNLVDFEFLPHYNRWSPEFINTVTAYSAKFSSLIYACRDGDGLVVNDNDIEFIGNIVQIKNGIVVSSADQ